MIIIQNILRIGIYGRVVSNSSMHNASFAGSNWLVPLFLCRPLLNETTNALFVKNSVLVAEKNEQSKQD